MTDKELLEAAAKAAGYEVRPYTWHAGTQFAYEGFTLDGPDEWNPLEDDGEALRLAVKLGIAIQVDYGIEEAIVKGWFGIPIDDNPDAAMRRAIVRAAAAIQEGKQ